MILKFGRDSMDSNHPALEHSEIRSALLDIVGQENITEMEPVYSKYRIQAAMKVQPDHERQVAELLSLANRHRLTVVPQGGGTKDAYGQSTKPADLIVSLKGISGVLEHSAGDLMVTVLAGTTLSELQAKLRSAGQFLPLDAAWDDQSTIGGIVNSGASGPLRAGYGSVRDFLIASRIVYPDGRVIRTGAKVVKNVAGYDMNKLFIGSMGTLGIHTEFTFKVRPIPAGQALMTIGSGPSGDLRSFQRDVLDSYLEPCVFEWLNPEMANTIGLETQHPVLLVGFADVESAVDEQLRMTRKLCDQLGAKVLDESRGEQTFATTLAKVREMVPNANQTEERQSIASLKMMGNITDIPSMYEAAQAGAAQHAIGLKFSGGASIGIARATVEAAGEDKEDQRLLSWIREMQSDMQRLGVRTVVDFAPAAIRNRISIWGEPSAEEKIMRGIKRAVDPNLVLNPGRIIGGE
jgi:glycolate oxidase FAD binding subunit